MRIANFPSPFRGEGLGEGRGNSLDQVLVQLNLDGVPALPKKVLLQGERVEGIASYVAGWMAGQGMDAIVLDGANRFDPYTVSSYARRALIPPEEVLKRIRIARAFTCYQMATLMGEKLVSFLGVRTPGAIPPGPAGDGHESPLQRPRVILLGPLTTFLDEDVPEREVRPLFERALRKVEEMAAAGVPFFLFQSPVSPGCKRAPLMKRLSQFSDLVWRISLEDQGPRMILEKSSELKTSLQIENCLPIGRQAK
jgi:hypothetical protein